MIEVRELGNEQINEMLARLDYGHLACCVDNEPYVVPIHYAYKSGYIYIYTTQGKKTEALKRNPRVCLQIEEVRNNQDWESAIIYGEAQELTDEIERSDAVEAVAALNPTLTPAVSIHWMDNWVRENIEVVYKMTPLEMTGRRAIPQTETRGAFVPSKNRENNLL
jgi:nitroimidazol reductase NimA-like FMN-containing flavoprotein (pyridoxamine 5'-phosphate oxidase superfamily)